MKIDKPEEKETEQEEKEMDLLLDEIPHATSPYHHHQEHPIPDADARVIGSGADNARRGLPGHLDMYACAAAPQVHGHGNGLMFQVSPSGSSSISSDDGLRRSPEPSRRPLMEELWLLDRLRAMHVGNGGGEAGARWPGCGPADPFLPRSGYSNAGMRRPFEGGYGVVRRSVPPSTVPFNEEWRTPGLVAQQHCNNLFDAWLQAPRSDPPLGYPAGMYPEQNWDDVLNGLPIGGNDGLGQNSYHRGVYGDNSVAAFYRSSVAEAFPQQGGVGLNQNLGFSNSPRPPMLNERAASAALANGWALQSPSPIRNLRNVEAFGCEDGLIIQGKGLRFVGNNGREFQREHRRLPHLDERLDARGRSGVHGPRLQCSPLPPLKYDNLMHDEGCIYRMAKDQHGCRLLQQKFDEGKPHEVVAIFNGIINHVVELMVNPFGNYLMQKLLEVCTEEQRMNILIVLSQDPAELVRISLNTHGTRAVQKLIETIKTPQQIARVVSALKPGFLDLIKDLNGNHVVQRCLQCLSAKDNEFIFVAAAEHCVDIATHRHGCCVLQRCIGHAIGEHRAKLVAEISANGLFLAQDAFGNYVVQYILELDDPSATAILVSQFEGHYVNLSTQKFSSNVVEKCLKFFGEEYRERIIVELLSVPRFEQLLQDPYANYVIQSALGNSKGSLYATLVEAIRPYGAVLRTSPYCKRIFSRTMLKK
ncbi:putative pumilio homolog 7, chloroplastic [Elaeis guineensis]|uniref:Pumilio homolog 7, chloroplastic n=1 Tax=Elaeis guineensis var. tenera TaxID=51953 RepID=A0A6I9S9H2_ELAGV|nr:putative pumilio homolog 7, chloroplastic [Elaeis guineensis]